MELNDIQQRQHFAEAYASFSQSRNGLGKVLGGIVGIVVILAGTLLGGGVVTGVLTVGATLLWLIGKEVIRARLYRPYGAAAEQWAGEDRSIHVLITGFVTLVSVSIIVLVLTRGNLDSAEDWIYLFFVAAMPLITWRFLRTPLEFIVGVFLLAACAVHGAGSAYSLLPNGDISPGELGKIAATWSPFIGAFVLILLGIREHRDFQELRHKMESYT